jgi:alpha-L-fucosidase
MDAVIKKASAVRPSKRQLAWQELEFYGFIHYGMNSFTDREWGDGTDSPLLFDPKNLDTDGWCQVAVAAGMKALILTAKHHDGFCLFDTAHTDYNVMNSPYGRDIAKELSLSCEKYGLKLGFYLSPWDRHDSRYGSGKAYDDYFCNQLLELMTCYGDLFCLWFDGACGEGPNGKVQVYDWERYYALIRKYQQQAVISIMGPDVRWCGNEAGHCRESEYSVVPNVMAEQDRVAKGSQQSDDSSFREQIPMESEDIGSRAVISNYDEFIWYPAEVDVSIRPGWFYHPSEDDEVKTLAQLQEIYLKSVGGNAALLLNIPPHYDGYIHENDANRLAELGDWICSTFHDELRINAEITKVAEGGKPSYIMELEKALCPAYLVLQEDIAKGQQVESFTLLARQEDKWVEVLKGTIIGHKRICPIPKDRISDRWKVRIDSRRGEVNLRSIELYAVYHE